MSNYWPVGNLDAIPKTSEITATLIISLRNESENISRLVLAIMGITYPKIEIILVDDHSEDETFRKLQQSFAGFEQIKTLSNPGKGKKAAIDYAISVSKGEIILTSDADCFWESSWVERILQNFEDPNIRLVAGPVLPKQGEGLLSRFQLIEWASILLVTNFGFGIHKPITCSAANLAYRRTAFEDVGGFQGNEKNPSGDDEFLLKKIVAKFGATSVLYRPYKEYLVFTEPEANWKALIFQKIRWAGKWKSHASFSHMAFSLIPFIFQLVWLSTFLFLFEGKIGFLTFSLLWSFKILAESLAFQRILRSLEYPFRLADVVKTSLIHPFYVVGIGMGILTGKYTWKGRGNRRSD
ncbi:glycosyltransferase [Algoriphagus sp.]|uniref:glycosyltransferase n=1 Tax=Algoriphagus sp. TaxID=1872435 RepID=UPI0025F3D2C8|nr:glycosyltransferase [Algoriphagus sp.]